jgi:hypothetical protein
MPPLDSTRMAQRRRWTALASSVVAATVALVTTQAAAEDSEITSESRSSGSSADGSDGSVDWLSDGSPSSESRADDEVRFVPQLQIRLRYRHQEGHDFASGGSTDTIRHRVRVGLAANYAEQLGALVQLQDVRTFGEEGDPVADYSADGFDIHQAYARFTPLETLEIRLGRQEIVVANSRLIGNLDFAEQARAFDAFRVTHEIGGTRLEGAYALVRDYPDRQATDGGLLPDGKRHLGLFHLGHEIMAELVPHVVAVVEGDTATDLVNVTAGALFDGRIGRGVRLDYTAEGYYQFGKEGSPADAPAGQATGRDAFLIATRARATAERTLEPYMEVVTAFISGDDNATDRTVRTFRAPYPTGHKFHGEMDLFLDFPQDTELRGLVDLGAALGIDGEPVKARAAFHLFDGLARRSDTMRYFGYELDFKARWQFWEHASVDALYGFFVPGELFSLGLVDPRVEHFAYGTVDVTF